MKRSAVQCDAARRGLEASDIRYDTTAAAAFISLSITTILLLLRPLLRPLLHQSKSF